jgi:hypothetical protein
VSASQHFVTKYGTSNDYGIVRVAIEFAGEKWNGIRVLNITGRLSPGGEWKVENTTTAGQKQ